MNTNCAESLVIYHANCADGFGAAYCAWCALGNSATYLPVQYKDSNHNGEILQQVAGKDVFILDFSFPKEVMKKIIELAASVVWLDHHKSAFEDWREGQEFKHYSETKPDLVIRLNNEKCGTQLAWEYFIDSNPNSAPEFVKYIDAYDRGGTFKGWAPEGTDEFMKALWSHTPWSFEKWNLFNQSMDAYGCANFIREGAAILRAHNQNVEGVINFATRKACLTFCGMTHETPPVPWIGFNLPLAHIPGDWYQAHGLAANCPPHLASSVGHELAVKSGTYGLCWYQNSDGKVNVSLRSNDDYDVSALAKSLGGGGHKNAAGFETTMEILQSWLT